MPTPPENYAAQVETILSRNLTELRSSKLRQLSGWVLTAFLQPLLELQHAELRGLDGAQPSKRKCQRNGQSHTKDRKAANDGRQPRDLAQLIPEGAPDIHGLLPCLCDGKARPIRRFTVWGLLLPLELQRT